jgi:hypothetical protein
MWVYEVIGVNSALNILNTQQQGFQALVGRIKKPALAKLFYLYPSATDAAGESTQDRL